MAAEDGLSQLSARQERRRRQPLPPRFPKSEPDQPGGDEPPAQQEGGETAAPLRSVGAVEVPATSAAREGPQTSPEPRSTPSVHQPAPPSPLRAAQHYIDDETDQALRACRAAGIVRRIDITNSAVVRLAVQRLVGELGADGVVDLLASEVGDRPRTGRKRR